MEEEVEVGESDGEEVVDFNMMSIQHAPKAMKFEAELGQQCVRILVDSGASLSFID